MADSWDDMRRVKEEEYFIKKNQEALARMKSRKMSSNRICPVDGGTMEQLTIMGVVVDRCPKCKGIWLDGGELEEIVKGSAASKGSEGSDWLSRFLGSLSAK